MRVADNLDRHNISDSGQIVLLALELLALSCIADSFIVF